jgi:hypothetical protein
VEWVAGVCEYGRLKDFVLIITSQISSLIINTRRLKNPEKTGGGGGFLSQGNAGKGFGQTDWRTPSRFEVPRGMVVWWSLGVLGRDSK